MQRLVAAALHRLGVVDALRPVWRRDLQDSEQKLVSQARKASADARAGHEKQRSLEDVQRTHRDRLKEAQTSVEALTARVAELHDTCKRLEKKTRGLEQVVARNRDEAGRLRDFRCAIETGAIGAHVARAIGAAPMFEDPAPMLVIDGLFPDDVYDTIAASLPPVEAFAPTDRTKANYRSHRPEVAVPDLTDCVWAFVERDMVPRTVVPALAARFAPYVHRYYVDLFGPEIGEQVARLPLEATDPRLMLRKPGYHLDPHLDPKRVLLTMLMYFARPGDSDAYGTSFYRVDGQIVRGHATTYYPERYGHRCELARTVAFQPNAAVVFLNSAAHGADIPASAPRDVERYAMQVYVGPPLDTLKEIVGGLDETGRRAWAELLV